MIVFYSWQSDLPYKTNRTFIEECLESAITQLNREIQLEHADRPDEMKEPIRLDSDTQGVLGIPEIASTIFKKIEACDVFVADVSTVGKTQEGKATPNPNVLIELGYAMASPGSNRILTIMNTDFGEPNELPFDLVSRRWPVQYSTKSQDRATVKKELVKQLASILAQYDQRGPDASSLVNIEVEVAYERSDFNTITSQRSFWIDVHATNATTKKITDLEVLVTVPRDIVLPNSQSGKQLHELSDSTKIIFQFPIDRKNPLPELLPGRRTRVAQIRCIVTDHVLSKREEIRDSQVIVELFGDPISKQEKVISLKPIDPFRLMDISHDSLVFPRRYILSEQK